MTTSDATEATEPTEATDSADSPEAVDSTGATAEELAAFHRKSRRSFLTFGVTALAGAAGYKWLQGAKPDDGAPWPLRRALDASARVQRTVFGDSAKVATFSAADARAIRVNGRHGLEGLTTPAEEWFITIQRNAQTVTTLQLADLMTLPKVTQTVDHKCIEGWSQVVTWSGVRMSDVINAAEKVVGERGAHIGLVTPNLGYYVTLERSAAMHPQTLLATKLNGVVLDSGHGAPCRVAVPTRYGIKSLKRLGVINLSDEPAPDYWAERGYDRYAAF
jgi:DMSO/TMAO reductase YedYZ molybdopterin-dependent catalytic subunit